MADKVKGRPVNNMRLHEIMKDQKCSRQWAYVLLRREKRTAARKTN